MVRSSALSPLLALAAGVPTPPPISAFRGATPSLNGVVEPAEWADATVFGNVATWDANFSPVEPASPEDLNITAFVKHDCRRLYFAFQVTDNLLYAFDTPAWLPAGNPSANNLTQSGWPWFGDEIEILLNSNTPNPPHAAGITGVPGLWQMVINARKSRLGGIGVGGLLEGEPRSSETAWANYQDWIYSRAMEAAVAVQPAGGSGAGGRWSAEVAIDLDPLVEVAPGQHWNCSCQALDVMFNVALGDVDLPSDGDATFGLRHEMWFSGNRTCAEGGNCHTLPYQFGTLKLVPGAKQE